VGSLVQVKQTTAGCLWYYVSNPYTREVFTIPQEDICHYQSMIDGNDTIPGTDDRWWKVYSE